MTEKIGIGIDDESAPGLKSIDNNLNQIDDSAKDAEKSLNRLGDASDDFGRKGADASNKSRLALTEFNQGLELGKKAVELLARGVQALSADGSPAFKRLQESVGDLQNSLLDLANDPTIQEWVDNLADGIKSTLIPTVNSIPSYWRGAQDAVSEFTTSALESVGAFTEGASDTLKQMQTEGAKLLDQQKQTVELERQRAAGQGRIESIQKQVAEQDRLMGLVKIADLNTVNDLLYDEQENLKKLASEGRATKQEQEESARRITLLEKRRLEIPREQAEAAKRAAEEAAKAAERLEQDRTKSAAEAIKAEEDYQRKVEAAEAAANKVREGETKAMIDALEKKKQELVALIEKAQGPDNKSAVQAVRDQISPEQTRAEHVRLAKEKARANFVFTGDDPNKVAGARRKAEKDAGIAAFRDFNAGKVDPSQIAGAQNTLIQNAAQQAQGRGQLDQQTVDALTQTLQNQQTMIQTQQQQQQVLARLNAALSQAGGSARQTNAQARRNLY